MRLNVVWRRVAINRVYELKMNQSESGIGENNFFEKRFVF
jgi:hypothetical protein